jgi:hypothetical protein
MTDSRDRVIAEIQGWNSMQWFVLFMASIILLLGIVLASDNVCADGNTYALSRMDCGYMANHGCNKTQFIDIRYYPETGLCAWNCLPHRTIATTTTTTLAEPDYSMYKWVRFSCRFNVFNGFICEVNK